MAQANDLTSIFTVFSHLGQDTVEHQAIRHSHGSQCCCLFRKWKQSAGQKMNALFSMHGYWLCRMISRRQSALRIAGSSARLQSGRFWHFTSVPGACAMPGQQFLAQFSHLRGCFLHPVFIPLDRDIEECPFPGSLYIILSLTRDPGGQWIANSQKDMKGVCVLGCHFKKAAV